MAWLQKLHAGCMGSQQAQAAEAFQLVEDTME
jgi:hypothetical protein